MGVAWASRRRWLPNSVTASPVESTMRLTSPLLSLSGTDWYLEGGDVDTSPFPTKDSVPPCQQRDNGRDARSHPVHGDRFAYLSSCSRKIQEAHYGRSVSRSESLAGAEAVLRLPGLRLLQDAACLRGREIPLAEVPVRYLGG